MRVSNVQTNANSYFQGVNQAQGSVKVYQERGGGVKCADACVCVRQRRKRRGRQSEREREKLLSSGSLSPVCCLPTCCLSTPQQRSEASIWRFEQSEQQNRPSDYRISARPWVGILEPRLQPGRAVRGADRILPAPSWLRRLHAPEEPAPPRWSRPWEARDLRDRASCTCSVQLGRSQVRMLGLPGLGTCFESRREALRGRRGGGGAASRASGGPGRFHFLRSPARARVSRGSHPAPRPARGSPPGRAARGSRGRARPSRWRPRRVLRAHARPRPRHPVGAVHGEHIMAIEGKWRPAAGGRRGTLREPGLGAPRGPRRGWGRLRRAGSGQRRRRGPDRVPGGEWAERRRGCWTRARARPSQIRPPRPVAPSGSGWQVRCGPPLPPGGA